jgi:hypothetical protein
VKEKQKEKKERNGRYAVTADLERTFHSFPHFLVTRGNELNVDNE